MLSQYEGKNVDVFTAGGSWGGTVIQCADRYLTLSTRFSSKHYIALDSIVSFWCDENNPEENNG